MSTVIEKILIAHRFHLSTKTRFDCPNGRGSYGIVYCIEGGATFRFYTGQRCELIQGDMLFLSPEAAYTIDNHGEFYHFTVNFTARDTEGLFNSGGFVFRSFSDGAFEGILSSLVDEIGMGREGCTFRSMSALYSLLALIYSPGAPRCADVRLAQTREYIDSHLSVGLTVERLADVAGMSVTSFRREWRRVFGETSMQYRDKRLIEAADTYLMSGYYNVSETAELLGFSLVSYFVRFYKKHKGISPGKVRM